MEEFSWLFFTALRLAVPLLIVRWSLVGIIASIALDVYDFRYLPLSTPEDYRAYQVWDKVLDIYYLAIAACTVYFWQDSGAKTVALFAFTYRVVGVLLFIIVPERYLMFLFPNFFENFFIFYLLYRKLEPTRQLFRSHGVFFVVVSSVLLPKLFQEYFLHVTNAQPHEAFRLQEIMWLPPDFTVPAAVQWAAYLLPPLVVLAWLTRLPHRVIKALKGSK